MVLPTFSDGDDDADDIYSDAYDEQHIKNNRGAKDSSEKSNEFRRDVVVWPKRLGGLLRVGCIGRY